MRQTVWTHSDWPNRQFTQQEYLEIMRARRRYRLAERRYIASHTRALQTVREQIATVSSFDEVGECLLKNQGAIRVLTLDPAFILRSISIATSRDFTDHDCWKAKVSWECSSTPWAEIASSEKKVSDKRRAVKVKLPVFNRAATFSQVLQSLGLAQHTGMSSSSHTGGRFTTRIRREDFPSIVIMERMQAAPHDFT